MKFLDIRTDFAFKKVFGSIDSKVRLMSFLNAIINFNDNAKIVDLTIVDPYNIPLLKGMKDTFVDVKALLDNHTTVIIEMQILNYDGFEKRILYNAAKNYSTQLLKGENYTLLNPIIALTIVDFIMFEDIDNVISYFKLIEKNQFITYSDDLEMIFIELPKFNKSLDELDGIQDQWIYFIKNAGSLEYIPDNIEPPIVTAFEISNTASLSKEELELQYKKQDFIMVQKMVQKNVIKNAEMKANMQGKMEGKIEMALRLLKVGVSIDIVAEASDMPVEQIQQLLDNKHNNQNN